MRIIVAMLFVGFISGAQSVAMSSVVAKLISNLAFMGNTEMTIISDFALPEQTQLIEALSDLEVPALFYNVQDLRHYQNHLPVEPCPIFGSAHSDEDHGEEMINGTSLHANGTDLHQNGTKEAVEKVTIRQNSRYPDAPTIPYFRDDPVLHLRHSLIPSQRYHKSMFFWLDQDPWNVTFDILDDTVMWCDQKIEVGLYNHATRFYFLVQNKSMIDIIFSHDKLSTHSQVVAFYEVDNEFKFYNFNFFHRADRPGIRLSNIWREDRQFESTKDFFSDLAFFDGYKLTVGTNPWAYHVAAEEIPIEEGGNATVKYRNYWGYEISILKALSKAMGFNYTIINPEDGLWGHYEEDGSWSGLVFDAAIGRVDFVISDVFITYIRNEVFDGSVTFDTDFQALAAPRPLPLPKYLSPINPFTYVIWVLIIVSLFVASTAFWFIANYEGAMRDLHYQEWAGFSNSIWYSFGTLVGESITRDTNSSKAPALRIVVGIWILYCLVVSASYAGNLKAFLTTPSYTSPINTLEEVLESGLPWGMVMYGEEEEEMMAVSTDPVIQQIWDGKIVAEYSPTPQIEEVYEGKKVFIDWKSGLQSAIFVRYTTPAGDQLIHKSPYPVFMHNYPGWGFHCFNPWRPVFDRFIRKVIESGLISKWKEETWIRMRQEAVKIGEGPLNHVERPAISAMTIDDLQGVFYLMVLMLLTSVGAFLLELVINFFVKQSQTPEQRLRPGFESENYGYPGVRRF